MGSSSWNFSGKGIPTGWLGAAELHVSWEVIYHLQPTLSAGEVHKQSKGWRERQLECNNKQEGTFILLQVRKRNFWGDKSKKSYDLQLSVVISSSNCNSIYKKKGKHKRVCHFNLQMKSIFTRLQATNVHTELYTWGQTQ